MSWRRLIWSTHRYCGLAVALFLLIAAVTGCLLVFRPQLDAAINPGLLRTSLRPALGSTSLAEMVGRAHPEWHIRGFELVTRPGHALCLHIAALADGRDQACIDPADAHVTGLRGRGAAFTRAGILQAVYVLHYTMFAGAPGRWFMGVVALLWLVLNVLGVLITLPRRRPVLVAWSRKALTSARLLRLRPLPELHRVAGLWLALLLCLEAYTSVAMNFFDEAFRPLVETLSPPRIGPYERPLALAARATGRAIGFAAAERAAMAAAATNTPSLSPVAIAEDVERGFYNVSFSPGGTDLYEGFGRVTYSIDRVDAHLVWIDEPQRDGLGRMLIRSLYPLHTGQIFGFPSQMAALLVGLASCKLVVTGVLPWWRRLRASVKKPS